MALIAIPVYDTEENDRAWMTRKTLEALALTVDTSVHRVFIVINAATEETEDAVMWYHGGTGCNVIRMPENVGTARAVNQAWKHRLPGEHAVKMDNDCVVHTEGWAGLMEMAIQLDPKIGVLGLQRVDLMQRENHPQERFRLYPKTLHREFEGSVTVERTEDVMGTCVMHNSALLDKVGYLYQPLKYGYDDVLMCVRSQRAGFYNAFIPKKDVVIEHIDPGVPAYMEWKNREVKLSNPEYHHIRELYETGKKDLYCPADY